MKRSFLLLSLTLIQLIGLSQVQYQKIKISNDLELIKLSEHTYVHVSYSIIGKFGRVSSNGLILTNDNSAFLFDTPATDSLTMVLITYLKDNLGLKVAGFIPNHWHEDCMGGLGYLQSHLIDSYANQKTIDIARTKGLPVPSHGFKDSLRLELGRKEIYCYFLGAAHSLDNIVVWIPSEKILFPGCMCKSLSSNDPGNVVDGDLYQYPATIEKVINKFKTAEIVIPGHGQIGGLNLLKHTRDLLNKLN
jgi:metallo-beta-lactamase class B